MRIAAIAGSIALLALVACEQKASQPTAEEFQQARLAQNQRVQERKEQKKANPAAAAAPATKIAPVPASQPTEDAFVGEAKGAVYDKAGMRDPFRSFTWERKELASHEVEGGPLEQFDVSQLSVIAVVWKTGSARALVEDPSGQSYIIAKGTRIGKNDGTVTKIDDNLVVVNETYEDYLGNVTQKDIEMRIRRSEGG